MQMTSDFTYIIEKSSDNIITYHHIPLIPSLKYEFPTYLHMNPNIDGNPI